MELSPPPPAAQYATGYNDSLRPMPADFNGDGKLDLADVDGTMLRAGVYFGNGDLTFQGAASDFAGRAKMQAMSRR